MRKKVRVSLPKLIHEVIYRDIRYFGMKKETIYNNIVHGLGFEKLLDIGGELIDEKKSISFNLNEINTELFPEMLKFHCINKDALFLGKLFMTYANLHPAIRERVLHKNLFLRVEQAIKESKHIKIYYNKQLLDVVPLAFERDTESGYNYLKIKYGNQEFLYEMKNIEYVA